MMYSPPQTIQQLNHQHWRADAWILWHIGATEQAQVLSAEGFGPLTPVQLAEQFHGQQPLFAQIRQQQKPLRATARVAGKNGQQRPLDVWTVPLTTGTQQRLLQLYYYESSRADELLQTDLLHVIPRQWAECEQSAGSALAFDRPQYDWQLRASQILQQPNSPDRLTNLLDLFCLQEQASRCSLFKINNSQLKLTALSGAVVWDNRSPVIRELQLQAESLHSVARQNASDQTTWQAASPANAVVMFYPLSVVNEPGWCLMVEQESNKTPSENSPHQLNWPVYATWISLLLEQLRPAQRPINGNLWLLIPCLTAGLLAVPIPLKITGQAVFWPQQRSEIYAPEAGIIAAEDLFLPDSMSVVPQQKLLKITSTELELQLGKIAGELATTQEQIRSLQSTRVESTPAPDSHATPEWDKSIRLSELTARKMGLEAEQQLLEQRLAGLTLVADKPGTILTWEARQRLQNRPVARGQLLLTIGNMQADWEVHGEIRDRDLAWFRSGLQKNDQQVEVRCAASPGLQLTGRLQQLAPMVSQNHVGERTASVIIVLPERPSQILPGTRCRVETVAGNYPAGFVWFRGLIETVRSYCSW